MELEDSANIRNYVELINLLGAYGPALEQHLRTGIAFSGLCNRN